MKLYLILLVSIGLWGMYKIEHRARCEQLKSSQYKERQKKAAEHLEDCLKAASQLVCVETIARFLDETRKHDDEILRDMLCN